MLHVRSIIGPQSTIFVNQHLPFKTSFVMSLSLRVKQQHMMGCGASTFNQYASPPTSLGDSKFAGVRLMSKGWPFQVNGFGLQWYTFIQVQYLWSKHRQSFHFASHVFQSGPRTHTLINCVRKKNPATFDGLSIIESFYIYELLLFYVTGIGLHRRDMMH